MKVNIDEMTADETFHAAVADLERMRAHPGKTSTSVLVALISTATTLTIFQSSIGSEDTSRARAVDEMGELCRQELDRRIPPRETE